MNPRSCITNIKGKQVAFIHIPKTGGQSVQRALKMGLRRHLSVRDKPRIGELRKAGYAFAYVRNPLTRAVSMFYWLSQLHTRDVQRRPENASLNQWARNTDVNTFWENVDVEYLDKNTTCNMFRSQSWFLHKRTGARLDPRINVLKFEDFANEWQKVEASVGMSLPLPHTNKSTHATQREELNTCARDRICDLYAVDFKNFYDGQTDT